MANTFKVGELLNKRSPVSKTWTNFDGSYTMELHDEVVHYMDEGGQLRDIKPMLSSESDADDFQAIQVPFDASVPRVFTSGYSISDGNELLTFTPVSARNVKGTFDPAKPNEVLYKTAWIGTDVKLELTPNSLKETIILKSEKAPTSFKFEIESRQSDLTLGNLKLAPAWLTDANGEYRDVAQNLRLS